MLEYLKKYYLKDVPKGLVVFWVFLIIFSLLSLTGLPYFFSDTFITELNNMTSGESSGILYVSYKLTISKLVSLVFLLTITVQAISKKKAFLLTFGIFIIYKTIEIMVFSIYLIQTTKGYTWLQLMQNSLTSLIILILLGVYIFSNSRIRKVYSR